MELEKLQVVINESKEIKSKLPSSQIVTDATKHLNDMTYDLDSATAEVSVTFDLYLSKKVLFLLVLDFCLLTP